MTHRLPHPASHLWLWSFLPLYCSIAKVSLCLLGQINFLSCSVESCTFKEGIFLIIHSKNFWFYFWSNFINNLQIVYNWVHSGWHTRPSIFSIIKKERIPGDLWMKTRKVLTFVKKQKCPLKYNNRSSLCLLYRKANNTRPEWHLWWSECVYCDWFTLEIM